MCKELLSNLLKEVRPGYAVCMRRSFEIIYKLIYLSNYASCIMLYYISIKLCKLYYIIFLCKISI